MDDKPVPSPVATYREFRSNLPLKRRIRLRLRTAAVTALSAFRRVPRSGGWIRFPHYHYVFDDERRGFDAHLRYMRNLGEILAVDDAVDLLESDRPLQGRYFCISFDDGFKNCITNAVPILVDHGASACFFVPTRYIGTSVADDADLLRGFHRGRDVLMEFLTWEDCRQMIAHGMTIGSHTVSHAHLIRLPAGEVATELQASKEMIERETNVDCVHFACPWGQPGVDFRPERDPSLATEAGYRSFFTTRRGTVRRKPAPLSIDRDHTVAAWPTSYLRYFFSR